MFCFEYALSDRKSKSIISKCFQSKLNIYNNFNFLDDGIFIFVRYNDEIIACLKYIVYEERSELYLCNLVILDNLIEDINNIIITFLYKTCRNYNCRKLVLEFSYKDEDDIYYYKYRHNFIEQDYTRIGYNYDGLDTMIYLEKNV